MDDKLDAFEDELRKLRPAGISKRLEQGIASTLAAAPPRRTSAWWQRLGFSRPSAALGWGLLSPTLAAAVAVAIVQGVSFQRSPTRPVSGPMTSRNQPAEGVLVTSDVRASNVVYQTQDEGVVLNDAREAVHRVRYRSADLVRWRNPATGVLWEVSCPREDVTLVPVHVD